MPKVPEKKVGLFGGSFNPVHLGHLNAARAAKELLRLDEIWLMPCAGSADRKRLLDGRKRLSILKKAVKGVKGFKVSDLEIKRGGVSRSVDTLVTLSAKYPEVKWTLLIGSDQAARFSHWKAPKLIRQLAEVGVLARPGGKKIKIPGYMSKVEIPQYEISSSEIRKRVQAGKSIGWMVPEDVVADIKRHYI